MPTYNHATHQFWNISNFICNNSIVPAPEQVVVQGFYVTEAREGAPERMIENKVHAEFDGVKDSDFASQANQISFEATESMLGLVRVRMNTSGPIVGAAPTKVTLRPLPSGRFLEISPEPS